MLIPRVQTLLREKLGFDASSVSVGVFADAIRDRMLACQVTDPHAYGALLRTGRELQELINAVVVPETWFFRDCEPFRLLQRHVADNWWRRSGETLRVLSIPCSTGEEPYSIAMTLLDAGLGALNCAIDAVDVSTRALGIAQQAIYGARAFRESDLSFRDRYFEPASDGKQYALDTRVRQLVAFAHGNVLDPAFADRVPYDVVCCRNLLIYLDRPGRETALRTLERLLKPGGLLFLGHAETPEGHRPSFESVRHRGAFAYRKVAPRPGADRPPPVPTAARRPAAVSPRRAGPRVAATRAGGKPSHRPVEAPTGAALDEVRRLADEGKLQEAALACAGHLQTNQTDADAHCLRGVILEAAGRVEEAEASYRKALYLDREHHEAIWHLVLLLEGKGRQAQADVLRQRAARLRPHAGA